jgi:dnd system-associated protein 4
LAVNEFQDTKILSLDGVDSEALRLTIFEEYANAGLARLERELRGAVDYTERLLLIISQERFREITATCGIRFRKIFVEEIRLILV